jgi:hypothetical protein
MSRKVCVLDPVRAELYEQKGIFPDCERGFHEHVSRQAADFMVGLNDGTAFARRLQSQRKPDTGYFDRQERIAVIPRIIRWHSVPAWMDESGATGPSVMQPVYENLR